MNPGTVHRAEKQHECLGDTGHRAEKQHEKCKGKGFKYM